MTSERRYHGAFFAEGLDPMTAALRARAIRTEASDAAFNMAVDEVLLEGAAARPTVRLYRFEPAALSLGRFQDPAVVRREAPALAGLPWVRRLSGGGAILHRHDLVFAVALPADPAARGDLLASYHRIMGGVAAALADLGITCDPARPTAPPPTAPRGQAHAPHLCLERAGAFDLTVAGAKICGAAQRRARGRMLCHGSIPLVTATAARTTAVGLVLGRPAPREALEQALLVRLAEALDLDLEPGALLPEERARADGLAATRYQDPRAAVLAANTLALAAAEA